MIYQISFFFIFCISICSSHESPMIEKDIKIVGGHKIKIEEAPWQVILVYHRSILYCGGSIISQDFVLTAGLKMV